MSSGLQVHTEGGKIIQLDSSYNNFRLSRRIRVVGTFNSPKIFICLPDHLYAVSTAKYGSKVAIIPKFTTVNGVIRQSYAVYGEALLYEFTQNKRSPSLSGLGLEMYAEDGSVIYSSNDFTLKVLEYVTGDLSKTAIRSTIQNNKSGYLEVNEDTPRMMFVPGLIPIRHTGEGYSWISKTNLWLSGFYQVSTLFFSRNLLTTWEGDYNVTYEPFYFKEPLALPRDISAFRTASGSSSFRYSYLAIDTSMFVLGVPDIELYP